MKTWSILLLVVFCLCWTSSASGDSCRPTEPDELGPFYKPDAPVRAAVGKGYLLSGTVRAAGDCSPLKGARIEFWLAGPEGEYADRYRATLFSDKSGSYRFESHLPGPYFGRPPHIHMRVSMQGYRTLVTQHYPRLGNKEAVFDLVLVPER